jgi:hypothetical protein
MDRYRVVDGRILNGRVEINVAEHCNLSCRACSHMSPVVAKSFADPAVVRRDLTTLAASYHARVVRLLGGEPLLHPDLPAVIAAVRESKVCDGIVVVTNGVLLPRMTPSIWSMVDAVEVSLYPGRSMPSEAQDRCAETADRHGVAIRFRECGEFQESYSEIGTRDDDLVGRIYATCNVAHRWRCHNVIDGWLYRCPQAHYIPRVLTEDPEDAHADGIRIESDPGFAHRLLAYLESPEPPMACSNCLGTAGRYHPQEQVRRREFRDRQRRTTEELVHPHLVGRARVGLARVESYVPRTVVDQVERALLSPRLVRLLRTAQHQVHATMQRLDHHGEDATTAVEFSNIEAPRRRDVSTSA